MTRKEQLVYEYFKSMSTKQNKTSAVFLIQTIPNLVIQNWTLEIISHHFKIIPKSFYLSPISCQPSGTLWNESDVINTKHNSIQRSVTLSTDPLSQITLHTWQCLAHLSEGAALRAGAGWSFSFSLPFSLPLHLRCSLWHSNPHKVDDVMEVRQQTGAWEPAVMAVLLNTGLLRQSEEKTSQQDGQNNYSLEFLSKACAFSCHK